MLIGQLDVPAAAAALCMPGPACCFFCLCTRNQGRSSGLAAIIAIPNIRQEDIVADREGLLILGMVTGSAAE